MQFASELLLFTIARVCSHLPNKTVLSRQMAEAGFFHSSKDRDADIVRCFVCFKELEGWEPEDNPLYVGALRHVLR